MTKTEIFNFFGIGDLLDFPGKVWEILDMPSDKRNQVSL